MDSNKNIENLVTEARQRASSSPYHGCATAVLTAVVDVLGLDYGDEVFRAMIGLAGGTGHLARGTCGALVGAAAAIGLSYNKGRQEVIEILKNPEELHPLDPHVPKFFQEIFEKTAAVARRMREKYGSILCGDIQFNLYGKTLDLLDPKKHWELVESFSSFSVNCFTIEGDVAGWTVETILKG